METVFVNIHITTIGKEKGLRISSKDANLDLLPRGYSKLPVQSENQQLDLELQVDGDSLVIRGEVWRNLIRHYDAGATVSLYRDDNGSYKIEARNERPEPSA